MKAEAFVVTRDKLFYTVFKEDCNQWALEGLDSVLKISIVNKALYA